MSLVESVPEEIVMTMLMERPGLADLARDTIPTAVSPELKVTIESRASHGFLVDPSGDVALTERFERGRKNLCRYFEWLQVPSKGVTSLVDQLLPFSPEHLPQLPFALLVSPRWSMEERFVDVFVNMAFRPYNELLVRVPAWSQTLLGHQPIERWVALQPHLARPGRIGFVGLSSSNRGRHALEIYVRADDLNGDDLTQLAALAGAPAARLGHLWQTLSTAESSDGGPALLFLRLTGEERLDIGVTFPAERAGSPGEIRERIELLARVHDLDVTTYLDAVEELTHRRGCAPKHTSIGFSSEGDRVALRVSLELGAPEGSDEARHFERLSLCRALTEKRKAYGALASA